MVKGVVEFDHDGRLSLRVPVVFRDLEDERHVRGRSRRDD